MYAMEMIPCLSKQVNRFEEEKKKILTTCSNQTKAVNTQLAQVFGECIDMANVDENAIIAEILDAKKEVSISKHI